MNNLIDEVWLRCSLLDDESEHYITSKEVFYSAITEALERQRRGCADTYVTFSATYFGQSEESIQKEYREEIVAILNAPPADA